MSNYNLQEAEQPLIAEKPLELDLSNKNLKTFPIDEIEDHPDIQILNLSGNRIEAIPDDFKIPSELVEINLSKNNFKIIPTNVKSFEWSKLKRLNLSENQVEDIEPSKKHKFKSSNPFIFSNFNSLSELDLSKNKIASIPEYIYFPSLKVLKLQKNDISSIVIKGKSGLVRLETLDLSENKIELPFEANANDIINKFPALKLLNLSGNKLTKDDFNKLKKAAKDDERDLKIIGDEIIGDEIIGGGARKWWWWPF